MTVDILSRDRVFFERLSLRLVRNKESVLRLYCNIADYNRSDNPLVVDISRKGGFEPDGLPFEADLYLCDESDAGTAYCFGKYSSVSSLELAFVSLFNDKTHSRRGSVKACRTVLFSSPAGGSGTSLVSAGAALAAAGECQKEGKRAFYLNLETVPAYKIFRTDEGPGLDSVLFMLNSKQNRDRYRILTMFAESDSGVDFIRPASNISDVAAMTPENLNTILGVLRECGRYSYIAVDCPFSFGPLFITAKNASDSLFLIENGTEMSKYKLGKVLENTQFNSGIIRNRYAGLPSTESENEIFVPDFPGLEIYDTARQIALSLEGTAAVQIKNGV